MQVVVLVVPVDPSLRVQYCEIWNHPDGLAAVCGGTAEGIQLDTPPALVIFSRESEARGLPVNVRATEAAARHDADFNNPEVFTHPNIYGNAIISGPLIDGWLTPPHEVYADELLDQVGKWWL